MATVRVRSRAGRHLRQRRGIAPAAASAAVFALAALTAGCGADFTAGTSKIRPDNPEGQIGSIKVRNALVVASPTDDRAVLSMAIVNDGDAADTLSQVAVEGGMADVGAGGITVPARGAVFVGSAGGPAITITRQGGKPAPGDFTTVALRFADSGELQISVPVYTPTGPYATLTTTPTPTPTPTPTGNPTPTESPTPTGSLSPAGSPTPTRSPTRTPTPTPTG